jgi:hypothetical protein
MTATPELQQLSDRAEIIDLVARLGACLDESRFDDMAGLLVEEARVRTPGGEAQGRAAVVAQAARNHPANQRFQHVITNVLVDLAGDRGKARANLVVQITEPDDGPTPPAPVTSIGEVYRFGLVRTPEGWRFTRIEIDPVWLSGVPPLRPQPDAASANASVATQAR